MDDHFSLFLEEFGAGEYAEPLDDSFDSKYAHRLPSSFLSFVRQEGFASYAGGLLWTLNPDRYSSYAQRWCDQIQTLAGHQYLVFARSAFGDMYALQEGSGRVISVSFLTGIVWASKNIASPPKNIDAGIQSFFGSAYNRDFDLQDDSGNFLFKKGVDLFGAINSNEMLGFEPALVLGGDISLENLRKVRMDVHIDLLSQLSDPVLRST